MKGVKRLVRYTENLQAEKGLVALRPLPLVV